MGGTVLSTLLCRLSIRHFLLVEQLDLDLAPGFTALTGETGAGKSILLDALELVLGGRADPGTIRTGAERAEIVAVFETAQHSAAEQWLADHALATPERECLMRRVVEKNGRSRALINGTPVTASQLRELGETLVDIHGQHAHQHLLHGMTQRLCLDSYGHHEALVTSVQSTWRTWNEARQALEQTARQFHEQQIRRSELDEHLALLGPLDSANNDWDTLQQEHHRWSHRADLLGGVETLLNQLDEGDQAVRQQLLEGQQRLTQLASHDPELNDCLLLLESARIEIEEATTMLDRYRRQRSDEEDRLPELEATMQAWMSCARRLRCRPEALPQLENDMRSEREALDHLPDPILLEQQEKRDHDRWKQACQALSAARQSSAVRLGQEVTACLSSLALGQGRFSVLLEPLGTPAAHGAERVEFQFSAHESLPAASLQRVASGGELARLGLALQTILSQDSTVPVLIFDEVDSGIGGAVAQRVGQMLADLGQHLQVLCVTHLPQVAACATNHLVVQKGAEAGVMTSRVTRLDDSGRVEEIARMLGGVAITETTRQHARELLEG